MAYGTLKIDNITYTSGGVDANVTISGLAAGNLPNMTSTGTISGNTMTGNVGQFTTLTAVTGVFTTTLSGATITGNAAQFNTITGNTAGFTTVTGNTVTGQTLNDNIGNVRNIPQNSQTSSYTLVAGDAGKHVFTTAGVTVPSGVFSIGQAISIYNNTTGEITITQGTNVTLRQAGASGTGNRTLAQRGLATVLCVSGANGTEFVIGGAGLS
jgi:hypothetical protein